MESSYYLPKSQDSFLHLTRPIVFFDLETTGTNTLTDRIVELCAIKLNTDGSQTELHHLINPTIPIPPGASEVHGITDEMVADKPTFGELADEIALFFSGCDLGGYNIKRFDVPVLMQEFHRFKKYPIISREVKLVDAMGIYHSKEKRDLSAAVKFYCQKEHINAHSAKADVLATIDILKHQLLRYDDLQPNTSFLHDYISTGNVDFSGKFMRDDKGNVVFNFGQHRGKEAISEPGYLEWMLKGDFAIDTKMVAKRILMNAHWQKEIKAWLDKDEIMLDLSLASALYTTVKFEKEVRPFRLEKLENRVTVIYEKASPSEISFVDRDAKNILLNMLEGFFMELGGYDSIQQKVVASGKS